jgi:oligopeptide transport system substrate-binding protein
VAKPALVQTFIDAQAIGTVFTGLVDFDHNVQVQQWLTQADVDQNQTERLKLYNMAEEQIVDDVGWIPIYQARRQVLQNPRLVGIVYNALDVIPPDDWGNIYITQ